MGHFELRVDRIIGSATDGLGTIVGSMWIEAVRRGRIIASSPTIRRPESRDFAFCMSIEDRFTGADLVNEEVAIIARDSRGNSGRLQLDGATELELIRDHLGEPCVRIFDLDFSLGGNARPYLGAGWSWAESEFTWTADDESFVIFESPAETGTYALRLTAGAFIHKPELSQQTLEIFLNEGLLLHFIYTEAHYLFHEIKFPHGMFGSGPRATLRLYHPDASRPSVILGGGGDYRRNSLNFKRLTLVRLLGYD